MKYGTIVPEPSWRTADAKRLFRFPEGTSGFLDGGFNDSGRSCPDSPEYEAVIAQGV